MAPPKNLFWRLAGREYPVRASGDEGELDGTSGDEGEWAVPAETKASWTRPTFGGVREALTSGRSGSANSQGRSGSTNWTESAEASCTGQRRRRQAGRDQLSGAFGKR